MLSELNYLITLEFENLDRLANEMRLLLPKAEKETSFIQIRAAGSILHDFYSGIEKIFERIAVAIAIDQNLPEGENWHTELLCQMAKPVEGKRNSVISEDLMQRLKEYLRFRHLFRHIYGFELKWDRIKPLCVDMEVVLGKLRREINDFLSGYRQPNLPNG